MIYLLILRFGPCINKGSWNTCRHFLIFFSFHFKVGFIQDFSVSNTRLFQMWQIIDADLVLATTTVWHRPVLSYILLL